MQVVSLVVAAVVVVVVSGLEDSNDFNPRDY
jgi:hypothetical protein